MPKMKSNRAAKKRFKLTATGKVKRRHGYLRHINTHMTSKRKRQLRGTVCETGVVAKKYIRMMGG